MELSFFYVYFFFLLFIQEDILFLFSYYAIFTIFRIIRNISLYVFHVGSDFLNNWFGFFLIPFVSI